MLTPGPFGRRQPTKIGGLSYILLGIIGLFIAGFVFVFSTRFGDNQEFWLIFGGVIALYGLFRIFTGIRILKKAAALSVTMDEKDISGPVTKARK